MVAGAGRARRRHARGPARADPGGRAAVRVRPRPAVGGRARRRGRARPRRSACRSRRCSPQATSGAQRWRGRKAAPGRSTQRSCCWPVSTPGWPATFGREERYSTRSTRSPRTSRRAARRRAAPPAGSGAGRRPARGASSARWRGGTTGPWSWRSRSGRPSGSGPRRSSTASSWSRAPPASATSTSGSGAASRTSPTATPRGLCSTRSGRGSGPAGPGPPCSSPAPTPPPRSAPGTGATGSRSSRRCRSAAPCCVGSRWRCSPCASGPGSRTRSSKPPRRRVRWSPPLRRCGASTRSPPARRWPRTPTRSPRGWSSCSTTRARQVPRGSALRDTVERHYSRAAACERLAAAALGEPDPE